MYLFLMYLGKGGYFTQNVLEISNLIEWIHTVQIAKLPVLLIPMRQPQCVNSSNNSWKYVWIHINYVWIHIKLCVNSHKLCVNSHEKCNGCVNSHKRLSVSSRTHNRQMVCVNSPNSTVWIHINFFKKLLSPEENLLSCLGTQE